MQGNTGGFSNWILCKFRWIFGAEYTENLDGFTGSVLGAGLLRNSGGFSSWILRKSRVLYRAIEISGPKIHLDFLKIQPQSLPGFSENQV